MLRTRLVLLLVFVFVCSVVGTWYFGYKYYWWIYYPSHAHTNGGPALTNYDAHLWTYGLWSSIIVGVVSLITIIKLSIDGHIRR